MCHVLEFNNPAYRQWEEISASARPGHALTASMRTREE